MTEWLRGNELGSARGPAISAHDAARRLSGGAEPRQPGVGSLWRRTEISERHRHRYEVNTAYKDRLEQHGLRFSGLSPDGVLPEIVEYEDHPWFIGVHSIPN